MVDVFAVNQGNAVMRKPHFSGLQSPQQLIFTLTLSRDQADTFK